MRFRFWPFAIRRVGRLSARKPAPAQARRSSPLNRILQRAWYATLALVLLVLLGTAGFVLIGEGRADLSDALYMTLITISTVGYGEIVPLQGAGGRIFAGLLSLIGFGTVTFLFTSLTFFFFENDFDINLRRHRMRKKIDGLRDHFIVCGYGRVGQNVGTELALSGRPFVALDADHQRLHDVAEREPELVWLHGDATDDPVLIDAGIERARGIFAVSNDDAKNMMIALTAKQLNPSIRVVARCLEARNEAKLAKAGADQVILPDFTGGLRIVAMMIRPRVQHFMEEMLRSDNRIRMEEAVVPAGFVACRLDSLRRFSPNYIIMAVRVGSDWHFNPQGDFELQAGHVLVALTNPAGQQEFERMLG